MWGISWLAENSAPWSEWVNEWVSEWVRKGWKLNCNFDLSLCCKQYVLVTDNIYAHKAMWTCGWPLIWRDCVCVCLSVCLSVRRTPSCSCIIQCVYRYAENFRMSEKGAVCLYHHLLGAFVQLRKATVIFVMSVRPHGTTRLLLDWFSWNLIFEYFSEICRENASFIKIWQE
jgi:hypothetical protein